MPGGIHPPLEVILAWPKPNYIDPELRPNTVTVLACVLGPLTVALLLARLWVRIFHQRSPGCDDWLMLAATVPTITLTVMYPLASSNGFDRHIWDVKPFQDTQKIVTARKYILALECIFCFASGLIKVSILLFYRRLSSHVVSKSFKWTTWISIGFIVAYSIALTLAPILGCQPISAFWDQVDVVKKLQGYKYHCFDEGADVVAASVISAAQDLIAAVLPTFLYWNLRIPFRQKVALFSIFAIGYSVVALGALRAYYSWRTFYETYDVTWSTWDLTLTCMLELHIGCFCANAPALKVFLNHFFHEKLTCLSRTKTPVDSEDRKDSAHSGLEYARSTPNVLAKFSALRSKDNHSLAKQGYTSDSHPGVSVDTHSGVHVQKEIHVTHSPASNVPPSNNTRHVSSATTDIIYDQYYDDIELGRYTTGHNSRASSMRSTKFLEEPDISALPPMPTSPKLPHSAKSFLFLSAHPQSPIMKELPRLPQPAVIPEESGGARIWTPFPSRIQSQRKPDWQTWS